MTRLASISVATAAVTALGLAGCGDDGPPDPSTPPFEYGDPEGGALRLVHNRAADTPGSIALDLIVGDQPLPGYATGFNLPLAPGLVTLAAFMPGVALDPGSSPVAAHAVIPAAGPLAGMLVAAQSQKAAGPGAVATDTGLAPGSVLFTVHLALAPGAAPGVVFDGLAPGFVLPSGGLRDRAGLTVVQPSGVAIGRLEAVAR